MKKKREVETQLFCKHKNTRLTKVLDEKGNYVSECTDCYSFLD